MADASKIEWTDATWNPVVGCSVVSPGCKHCYAMAMAHRINQMTLSSHYEGLTARVNGKAVWTGKLALAPKHILRGPLSRRKPTKYFVNSMGDLFHEDCPDAWIDQVFAVMALSARHTFQVLTKRAGRMRAYCCDPATPKRVWGAVAEMVDRWHDGKLPVILRCIDGSPMLFALAAHGAAWGGERPWPFRNVWLGVSVEDQARADERIPELLATPAGMRFLSAEPLLGPVDLQAIPFADGDPRHRLDALTGPALLYGEGLDWVIAGGESGPGARPMHPEWARALRDQCRAAGVPFFFKQWGEWHPCEMQGGVCYPMAGHAPFDAWVAPVFDPDAETGWNWRRVGKRRAGRLLDGREWSEFPETGAAA